MCWFATFASWAVRARADHMKLLFVLRFVLLFLGLGAMGIVSTAPQAFAAGSAKEEGSSDVEEHHYVRLDTITVTLFDKDSVVGL